MRAVRRASISSTGVAFRKAVLRMDVASPMCTPIRVPVREMTLLAKSNPLTIPLVLPNAKESSLLPLLQFYQTKVGRTPTQSLLAMKMTLSGSVKTWTWDIQPSSEATWRDCKTICRSWEGKERKGKQEGGHTKTHQKCLCTVGERRESGREELFKYWKWMQGVGKNKIHQESRVK